MTKRETEQGFTVVELLIALTVLSLLVVVLVSVLDVGRRVFAATTREARKYEETAAVRTLLKDIFGQVTSPSPVQAAAARSGRSFAGTPQSLTVLSWGPRMIAAHLPVEFQIGPAADNKGLEASWQRNRIDDGNVNNSRRILAADGDFRFAYLAPSRGWTDSWNDEQPPTHVRLQIVERGNGPFGNREEAISMIFEVRRLAPVECSQGATGRICAGVP